MISTVASGLHQYGRCTLPQKTEFGVRDRLEHVRPLNILLTIRTIDLKYDKNQAVKYFLLLAFQRGLKSIGLFPGILWGRAHRSG